MLHRWLALQFAAWGAGGVAFYLSQSVLWTPGLRAAALRQLVPRATVTFLVTTALIYHPLMNWLRRRGDGREPDGHTAAISFILLGAVTYVVPLEFTFPGLFWLPGFVLPTEGMAPFTIGFAVSGAVYGLLYARSVRRHDRNRLT